MNDPRLILGVITEINGTTPGRASDITYTIMVSDPATPGTFPMERQKPFTRWPDEIDIVAREVGKPVFGVMLGGEIIWDFWEQPAFAECPSGLTPQQRAAMLRGEVMAGLLPGGFEVVQGVPTNPEGGLPEVPN